jgi:hypothetical protein
MAGKVILQTDIPREKGYLYYCSSNSDGNITVCKAEMSRGRQKKKK